MWQNNCVIRVQKEEMVWKQKQNIVLANFFLKIIKPQNQKSSVPTLIQYIPNTISTFFLLHHSSPSSPHLNSSQWPSFPHPQIHLYSVFLQKRVILQVILTKFGIAECKNLAIYHCLRPGQNYPIEGNRFR